MVVFYVSKELPRIEKEVEDFAKEFEERHGQPFLVKGRSVGNYILDHWHRYHDQRKQEKKERVCFPHPVSVIMFLDVSWILI